MNIWSFPREPVTDGPLKLRDTALCLWHCGIYRRKRSNSSAEREHEKVNTVSWRFTCLEALFVSDVLTTNVWGQQSCTMFAFLEMIVYFNVFLFFLFFYLLGLCLFWECCFSLQKNFLWDLLCSFVFCWLLLSLFFFWILACMCMCSPVCVCVSVMALTAVLEVCAAATCGIPPSWDQMEKRYMASHCFPINTSPASTIRWKVITAETGTARGVKHSRDELFKCFWNLGFALMLISTLQHNKCAANILEGV